MILLMYETQAFVNKMAVFLKTPRDPARLSVPVVTDKKHKM